MLPNLCTEVVEPLLGGNLLVGLDEEVDDRICLLLRNASLPQALLRPDACL
jgi:hypothetical protein